MIRKWIGVVIKFSGLAILRTFDTLVAVFTANKAILTPKDVPFYYGKLAAHHTLLLEEYCRVIKHDKLQSIDDFFKSDAYEKVDLSDWIAKPIVLFNYLFMENALKYPETYKLVSQLPGCTGAMISVMLPGVHLPAHKGIYKGIYRCLFTLQVEKDGDCWIRIDDIRIYFKQGEPIFFDETVEHEVVNNSSQPRVVLLLDIYRKLPFPLNVMNNVIFSLLRKSPAATTIINKYKDLDKATTVSFTSPKSIIEQ